MDEATLNSSVEQSAGPAATVSPIRAAVEAILLVADLPVDEPALARAVGCDTPDIRDALNEMASEFRQRGSGMELRFQDGGWRFYTAAAQSQFVEKFVLDGAQTKLTRAALETLAVIAYRQPVTRARVSAVRGVNVDGVVRTLLARGLIAEAGTEQTTGANLYVTTQLFLELMGLDSLEQLPDLAPLLPEVDIIDEPNS